LTPPGVKKDFIKGEATRLLRTNSSETAFATAVSQFKTNLIQRGYPETLVSTTLAEIKFEGRNSALQQKRKENTRILPFVTQYRPSVPNLKQILMQTWLLIKTTTIGEENVQRSPYSLVQKGQIPKGILVRAKL